MASKKITMVDHTQIAKKGYKGCKSTRSVQNFCAKNKSSIDCCWYKPKGSSQKVLLIEMSSFRDCWKASQKSSSTSAKSTSGSHRTTTMKASSRSKSTTTSRGKKTRTTKLSARTTKLSAKSGTRRSTTGRTRTATQNRTRTTRLRRAA